MATDADEARIVERVAQLGLSIPANVAERYAHYLALLRFWNRRLNLTSLPLDPVEEHSIDRLLMEPLAASADVEPSDRLVVDVGSGGGSPVIPILLSCPHLRGVLVEARTRRAAFLRDALGELTLTNSHVEQDRVESLVSRPDLNHIADILTIRAVRLDKSVLDALQALSRRQGRIWFFGGAGTGSVSEEHSALCVEVVKNLVPGTESSLAIARVLS